MSASQRPSASASIASSPPRPPPKRTTANWKNSDVDLMLTQVQGILPRGADEWEQVAVHYRQVTGETDCTVDRIRTKFNNLARMRKPTGDHTLPPAVRRAKQIKDMIDERVESGYTPKVEDEELEEEERRVEENDNMQEGEAESGGHSGVSLSLHVSSSSAALSSSSSSISSIDSPARSTSSPSAHKRKRIDVDGLTKVLGDSVQLQREALLAQREAVLAQKENTAQMSAVMVQNSEMIRYLAQIIAERKT